MASEVKRPRIEVTKEDTDPQVEANISAKFDLCGLSGLGGEDGHIHIPIKSAYINKITISLGKTPLLKSCSRSISQFYFGR